MPTKVKILVKKSDGPARKRARLDGCTNQVVGVNGDVSERHGETETLSREGCDNNAKNFPPIANHVVTGGLCETDGIKRKQYLYTCTHDGCANQARKGGVCIRHGAKPKTCSHEGCAKNALKGGGC